MSKYSQTNRDKPSQHQNGSDYIMKLLKKLLSQYEICRD